MDKLKCYEIVEDYSGRVIVLFAETASKAKYSAYYAYEDYFDGSYYDFGEFMKEVTVRRNKNLDGSYRGRTFMDWDDIDDRLDLIREYGWYCNTEYDEDDLGCKECEVKEYCTRYKEYLAEKNHAECVGNGFKFFEAKDGECK